MTEFYQWTSHNFVDFVSTTAVLAVAVGFLIDRWRQK